MSEAKKRADWKYRKTRRKQIVVDMSLEEFDAVDAYCKVNDIPKATLIKRLLFNHIAKADETDPRQ
jgi:hypothetical protein